VRRRVLLVLTTIVLALAMANGTAMAVEMEDGISIPPEFPGMINNCSGLYRICLPTGDITLEADNTSGFCTWTYNIIWGDGGSSSFVSKPGITESASHKYVRPGIYTIDVNIPPAPLRTRPDRMRAAPSTSGTWWRCPIIGRTLSSTPPGSFPRQHSELEGCHLHIHFQQGPRHLRVQSR